MANVDLIPYADIIVSSLTKYVAGNARVMGGSAVVSPQSPQSERLVAALAATDDNACWNEDITLLTACAEGFPQRVAAMSRNAKDFSREAAAARGRGLCFIPDQCPHFRKVQRSNRGYGSLCSVVLHRAEMVTPRVYDALDISKGPSLVPNSRCAAHLPSLPTTKSLTGLSHWMSRGGSCALLSAAKTMILYGSGSNQP